MVGALAWIKAETDNPKPILVASSAPFRIAAAVDGVLEPSTLSPWVGSSCRNDLRTPTAIGLT